ncbi:MAG: Rrf2 family transcriptional regulator [Gammaproteobacteria bacterium]|jgi:Rrf2 family transcriptional regulator, nitric oxide-sensitive transcriptional repressor|nr:Rrf2 family transcriptional regulator [Gammaproteobacteria bacterium]
MKLQTATRLALYAVLELAAQPDQQFSRMEIAKKFNVSSNHLSKVMRDLGKAGLVDATRGVGGGYWFVGNAKRTTLLDIIKIFEPFPFDSTDRTEPGQETEVGQALDVVLDEISESIHATLDTISISTMLSIKDRIK